MPCTGVAPMQCLQVRRPDAGGWELFYNEIKGFRHEAGFAYTLAVRADTLPHPPADGSKVSMSLLRIIRKEKMHTENPQAAIGTWQLSRLRIQAQLANVPGDAWRLEIGDSSMGAQLCNRMQGKLLMGPQGQWIAGPLARTKMMCPEIAWEDAFVQCLTNANSYQLNDSILVLLQHGTILAEFKRTTQSTQIPSSHDSSSAVRASLAAGMFRVQFITDDQGRADMRAAQATMRFDPDKSRVSGTGGCNRFFADARFTFANGDSGKLVMGKAGSTLMACPQYMDLEQRFFRLLEQADGFRIDGKKLQITRMSKTIIELLAD